MPESKSIYCITARSITLLLQLPLLLLLGPVNYLEQVLGTHRGRWLASRWLLLAHSGPRSLANRRENHPLGDVQTKQKLREWSEISERVYACLTCAKSN